MKKPPTAKPRSTTRRRESRREPIPTPPRDFTKPVYVRTGQLADLAAEAKAAGVHAVRMLGVYRIVFEPDESVARRLTREFLRGFNRADAESKAARRSVAHAQGQRRGTRHPHPDKDSFRVFGLLGELPDARSPECVISKALEVSHARH